MSLFVLPRKIKLRNFQMDFLSGEDSSKKKLYLERWDSGPPLYTSCILMRCPSGFFLIEISALIIYQKKKKLYIYIYIYIYREREREREREGERERERERWDIGYRGKFDRGLGIRKVFIL